MGWLKKKSKRRGAKKEEPPSEENVDLAEAAAAAAACKPGSAVMVDFDFEPMDPSTDLRLVAGTIVTVLETQPDGWWYGRDACGKQGHFPYTYTTVMDNSAPKDESAGSGFADAEAKLQKAEAELKRVTEEFAAFRASSSKEQAVALSAMQAAAEESSSATKAALARAMARRWRETVLSAQQTKSLAVSGASQSEIELKLKLEKAAAEAREETRLEMKAEFDTFVERQHQHTERLAGRNWALLNDLARRPQGSGGVSGDELSAAVKQAREQGAAQELHRCEARIASLEQEHKMALANAQARRWRALTMQAKKSREREKALEGLLAEARAKSAADTRVVVAKELDEFRARYLREAAARRALYNRLVEIEGNIRVFCRVRPVMPFELAHGGEEARDVTKQPSPEELVVEDARGAPHKYTFDCVFGEDSTQRTVFNNSVSSLVTSVLDGFDVCIFAYGQYVYRSSKPTSSDNPRRLRMQCAHTCYRFYQ